MTYKLRIFCLAVLLGTTAMFPLVRADQGDKEASVTFTAPVEVPGQVLPPGRYIFKVASGQSDLHIVQIYSGDQNELLATIPAIPAYRLDPSDDTLITFEERPTGSPEAVKRWFCSGDLTGTAFLYPEGKR